MLNKIICFLIGHDAESNIHSESVVDILGNVSRDYICGRCGLWESKLISAAEYKARLDLKTLERLFGKHSQPLTK